MAENVGSADESEFGSVTSSQISFLHNCPFADPHSPPTKSSGGVEDTDSNSTEVIVNPISPPVTRTPILSLSTPISVDSINDEDVFRTPPENAFIPSETESEPRVRVSEIKHSKLKSPSPKTQTTHVSASPSENVMVLETNRVFDSEDPVTEVTPLTSPPCFAAGNVCVPDLNTPFTMSITAGDVRVPGKHSDTPSPIAKGRAMVLEHQPVSDPVANTRVQSSPSPGEKMDMDSSYSPYATQIIKIIEKDEHGGNGDETDIPFKEVIEALLRNNGENLHERDERVSYTDSLKQFGLKFP